MDLTLIVALVIALSLVFDFTNGFHDTANAMATPIATGAMRPKVAVGLAAVLNLVGAFLSTEVAKTVSGGIIREGNGGVQITPQIIFAGLIGAIVWNLITWLRGLPSSSSHALFGGLIGAAIIGIGVQSVDFGVVFAKVILPALIAPVTVGVVALIATRLAYFITRRDAGKADGRGGFRYAQIFSSSLVALAHGTNDAQKTMGVITLTLIAGGFQAVGSGPQWWVICTCALAIAIGTYTGGWRIILTMGRGLTDVKPAQGFAAETSTAATILASSHLGFALSTTQVASGSVIGSGLGRRGATVRWGMAGQIALGWLLTLPASAVMGAFAAGFTLLGPIGLVIDLVLGSVIVALLFRQSRRTRITHDNLHDIDDAALVVKIKKTPRRIARRDRKKVSL
ncbi:MULTISPECIES: inorganic phosphate transporter [unclassified Cryobacterium]|uniref:inorganic phosphate transporter n=1 Tax=unclassified Cryobacterium TaxID=2649013 RepID=UPI002AB48315|nr:MULTISPECIES: inorganic phosphate transporter [unclassified Cryobacterium]MDY7543202.1 anion permease [Cryobacterium sp. 5B3]MEA9998398.1 inorganic phosphate transporter [Cryobacterium sp. RTS3]MEB0265292.1 inorganic phosphate transporter [Cryobacterium sp. 10I5]MEB0274310.1 inorganic phosphate transporter [Cryobacterium sp. 5B3]